MPTRVYLLLNLAKIKPAKVANDLKGMPGITAVDMLEGPPDLLTVIEAPARQKAAEYLMGVMNMLDGVLDDIRVLPVCEPSKKKTSRNHETRQKAREEMTSYV
jgi:hypothetical protein